MRIALVDAGTGNLRSVEKALRYVLGSHDELVTTSDPAEILRADRIVMPGQGAFGDCGRALAPSSPLGGAILDAIEAGRPYFGICLGMQVAVIEFARNVCGLTGAHSTEMDPDTAFPVIDLMAEQKSVQAMGGTMRLGAYECALRPGTLAAEAYGNGTVSERHRHRFEVNNRYLPKMTENGLVVSGVNEATNLVEIVELPRSEHPWFLGCQFHPEFKSRPLTPHPLFDRFIAAAKKRMEARTTPPVPADNATA